MKISVTVLENTILQLKPGDKIVIDNWRLYVIDENGYEILLAE